jgi:hypothetical protein
VWKENLNRKSKTQCQTPCLTHVRKCVSRVFTLPKSFGIHERYLKCIVLIQLHNVISYLGPPRAHIFNKIVYRIVNYSIRHSQAISTSTNFISRPRSKCTNYLSDLHQEGYQSICFWFVLLFQVEVFKAPNTVYICYISRKREVWDLIDSGVSNTPYELNKNRESDVGLSLVGC